MSEGKTGYRSRPSTPTSRAVAQHGMRRGVTSPDGGNSPVADKGLGGGLLSLS
jgi:hypothetical protein